MTTPMSPTRPANWMKSRVANTSDALDRAFAEGLTGHVVTWRDGKRVRVEGLDREAVEFVSCSYLGLESHPALVAAAHEAMDRFGVHLSAARNRMRPPYLLEFEDLLMQMYRGSPVVVFTSVSNVHLGVLPLLGAGALPSYPVSEAGPAFLVERTAHSSMQVLRGVLEQLGPTKRFDLDDPESLPARLNQARGRTPIVLVDGVGSMGGLIDVRGLQKTMAEAGGYLYIDDAHGISISGLRGAGYAFEALGDTLPDNVILAGSLSKAFGGSGSTVVVAGPGDVRVITKLANPLVFGHSIMVPMMAANVAAARLHLSGEVKALQERLWANTSAFDELTGGELVNASLRSPVRGARFMTEESAFAAAHRLRDAGILVLPAFYPTVAAGTGLIRFAISALHTTDQLAAASAVLDGAHAA
jgi:7-keto-8-aminopelargonate synthetase-like enzyme